MKVSQGKDLKKWVNPDPNICLCTQALNNFRAAGATITIASCLQVGENATVSQTCRAGYLGITR